MKQAPRVATVMTEWTADDLSPEEAELLTDFAEWLGDFDRQMIDRNSIKGDNEEFGFETAIEYLTPYISAEASEFDAQIFRLYRLKRNISGEHLFEYEKDHELPPDAVVTPDELNKFLQKDELEEFFTISGQMVETLSTDLLINEIVDDSRESKSVRNRIERMPQSERDWLLYISGTISEGQKSEIKRLYDLRSSVVHESDNFIKKVNVPSDVERSMNTINDLHEELHGIGLDHRFGDIITRE